MVTGRLRQRSWETPEGDKRSVTEIEADEVGASLKWATAKVERTSQRGNGDRTQGRERQAERGDFNDAPPSENPFHVGALGSSRGRYLLSGRDHAIPSVAPDCKAGPAPRIPKHSTAMRLHVGEGRHGVPK
jgi:single-stranded DNA-binding protein